MKDAATFTVDDRGGSASIDPFKPQEPLGVSGFLPRPAAMALVRAAESAKCFQPFSVERQLVLDRVIRKVREEYPRFFADGHNGSKRPGAGNRRASPERKVHGSRG